jgi:co-chaperonin GroES (HSP10)
MSNESGMLPMEFHVIVKPDPLEEVSPGGIILRTEQAKDRDKLAIEEGTLVAVSPMAFTYADWPEGARKPEVGDRVVVKRHAGWLRTVGKQDYRILNDKDIVAIIEPPARAVAAAA